MVDQAKTEAGEISSLAGTSVGRFVLRERLGKGGMGEVYRAEDTKLNRSVAIKRMSEAVRSDPDYRRRFVKEAERASQLSDPHIAALYDILEEQGDIFLVMEFVEGSNLRQLLARDTKLKDFLAVAIQAAEGLRAAHARQIVHCDIKPENIMISTSGQVKILDFGVARQLSGGQGLTSFTSETIKLSGTPGYMAPEVMMDEAPDQRSDIFSLGVVFYEALSGEHPFRRRTVFETADSVLHTEPAALGSLGVEQRLSEIIGRMMAKDPAQRYQNVNDVVGDLQEFAKSAPTDTLIWRAQAKASAPTAWKQFLRQHKIATIAAVVFLVLLAGLVPAMRQARRVSRVLGISKAPQVAVLSFQSIGGKQSDQAFADGLSDVITSELTQLTDRYALQVVPATEVRSSKVTSVASAKQMYGVDLVVEGSIQPVANMIRATFSVIDAHTGRQVKAGTISVPADDPFGLQDQLADNIVRALGLDVSSSDQKRITARGTTASAAYDEYLQGLGYLEDYQKKENIDQAIGAFNRALQHDSAYALAYAGLGEAYWYKYREQKDSSAISDATLACQRALAIDRDLVEGHRCLGEVFSSTGKYSEAAQQLEVAVKTRPTDDQAVRGLGMAYEKLSDFQKAEATYQRAIDLRPHYWAGYNWLGSFYFKRGQYEKALQEFHHVIAIAPDNYRGYNNAGAIYLLNGDFAGAENVFGRSVQIQPSFAGYSNLGTAYFFQRRFSDAVGAYSQSIRLNGQDYVTWGNLGDAQYFSPNQRASSSESYRKAIVLADQALKVNPKDAYALGSSAIYHAMLGDREQAEDSLQHALALKPEGPDVWWQASVMYSQFSRNDETLHALQSAVAAGFSSAYINSAPYFDNLRSDARFQQLIRSAERLENH
jgi:tetratricopeptide (TPR) repeat protein/predicted Ser/Thr protein kinase